ncbi:unnamed protein product [Caenorhabditis nigoni]
MAPPKPPGASKYGFRTTAQYEEEIRNLSEILQKKNEEISQMNVDFAAVIKDTMDESNEKTADLKRKIRDLEAKISEKDGENYAELVIPGTSSDRVIIKNSGIFEIQNLKDRLEKLDRLIKHKDSQIESLQAEKSQTHYDFNEKMKEALQIADRDLDEANRKINSLERKLEISTKEAEGFFSDLQKIAVGNTKTPSKGSQDVPDASGFMARKLKAENIGLKLDNDRLSAKIQSFDSQHTAEIKELNRKIDNLQNRLESEVSARLETKRELDHSFDQRVNDKKAYDKDLERHQEKIHILETRVKNAEAASFQCTEDGRNKEKLLTKQIKGLQAQVAAYGHMTAGQDKDATIWKLTMDLQAALMENDRLKSELSAKNAYGGDEELQKRIQTLTAELEEKRAVIAQYDQKDSRLDEAFEEIQILRKANEEISRKLSNGSDGHLQKRIESLTVELKKQKDSFDQAKARNYDTNLHLMAKIEELKANNGHQNDSG